MIPRRATPASRLLCGRTMRTCWPSCLVLLSFGCADTTVPITTGDACGQSEIELQVIVGEGPRDVLVIIEPELARSIEPRLRVLLAGLISGRADDDSGHRLRRDAELRVAMLSPADAADLVVQLADAEHEPAVRFNRYRYAPYGYEDDVAAFVERVLCPLHADRTCESSSGSDGEPYGLDGAYVEAFVITERDACGAGEQPVEGGVACDPELTKLVAAWRDYPTSPVLSVIAGAPADRLTLEAYQRASDWPADVLQDPRMHGARDADICDGAAERPVQAAPVLIEALAEPYTALASLCSSDLRGVLQMSDCGYADWALPVWLERIGRDSAGLATCEWHEVLPAEGLITHCAQLAAFGRAAEPIEIVDDREVCAIEQIAEADADTAYGWYMPSHHDSRSSWPTDPDIEPQPRCSVFRSVDAGMPALSWLTEAIAGSQLTLRCRLTTAAAASCD